MRLVSTLNKLAAHLNWGSGEGGREVGYYLLRLQIDKHQVVIRAPRHKRITRLQQRVCQSRTVLQHLRLVLLKLRRRYLLQRRGQSSNSVVVGATLRRGEGGREGKRGEGE